MKLGYFTLSDNPPSYGESRQDHNQLIVDITKELSLLAGGHAGLTV